MAKEPVKFSDELADDICNQVATNPIGLDHLCAKNPHWPNQNTIYEWRHKYVQFGEKYAKAKQSQIDVLVDEIVQLTSDKTNDFYYDTDGKMCPHTPHLTRLRYRIDTIKWLASKLAPKVYGDSKGKDEDKSPHDKYLEEIKDLG